MKKYFSKIQEQLAVKEKTYKLDYSKYIRDTFNIRKKYTCEICIAIYLRSLIFNEKIWNSA